MKQILVIEDDTALRQGIVLALSSDELQFDQAATITEAKERLKRTTYDLLILDVNLPDGSGFNFCQDIRQQLTTPIILLTARDLEIDIVTGLDSGADDYITKPFSLMVLRARVTALLRRYTTDLSANYHFDQLDFDFQRMVYKRQDHLIDLSKTEQKLLRLLVSHPNQTLTRNSLIEQLWSVDSDFIDENALSVTIKRLRQKIETQPSAPLYIKTVYGVGYRWESSL